MARMQRTLSIQCFEEEVFYYMHECTSICVYPPPLPNRSNDARLSLWCFCVICLFAVIDNIFLQNNDWCSPKDKPKIAIILSSKIDDF